MTARNLTGNSDTGRASNSVPELVRKVNGNRGRVKRGIPPLEFVNAGWRIEFDQYLEDFTFCKAGKELLNMAVVDSDSSGIYYWIPISDPPKGVTTPAIRLMALNEGE